MTHSIRRVISEYYKQLNAIKLDNMERIGKFLEGHKLPKKR
jgi:hypothetical protein